MAPVIAHSDDIRGHVGTDHLCALFNMYFLVQNVTGLRCGDQGVSVRLQEEAAGNRSCRGGLDSLYVTCVRSVALLQRGPRIIVLDTLLLGDGKRNVSAG